MTFIVKLPQTLSNLFPPFFESEIATIELDCSTSSHRGMRERIKNADYAVIAFFELKHDATSNPQVNDT